jgi:hypothetical protein
LVGDFFLIFGRCIYWKEAFQRKIREWVWVPAARESEAWDAEALCFKIVNGIFESKIFSVYIRGALLNRRNYVRMFEDLNS